jgi:hypothetical protein
MPYRAGARPKASAIEAKFLQCAVEQLARRTHEGAATEVLGIARLLADHQYPRVLRPFAEHGLRRRLP